jgi:sucrose-6-phosphate hydrolase SacC (GH32 family)
VQDVVVSPDSDPLKDRKFSGDTYELIARFENVDAREFGFKLRVGDGQETVVGYDVARKELFVDRTRSGQNFHNEFPARHAVAMEPSGSQVALHILVDRSSVEVLGAGGTVCITDVIFPDPQSNGLSVYARDGRARLVMLNVSKLNSAWR